MSPFFAQQEAPVQSGSGAIWDAAGHVVTNNHVVQNAGCKPGRFCRQEGLLPVMSASPWRGAKRRSNPDAPHGDWIASLHSQ
ncbi:hypothetical protein DU475_13795 [Rhodopseudomonas sp. WA056]|nr:hypothetical protein [Rhodopseudomonas sp. WA056]